MSDNTDPNPWGEQQEPKTEPVAEPKADPQAEPAAEHQPEPEPKVVPLAALHEERGKRKDLQQELAAERSRREQMEARVEQRLAQLAKAVQPPAPAAPTLEENPVGHFSHQINTLTQHVNELSQQTQQEREVAQAMQRMQQISSRVIGEEQAFRETHPDYSDAVGHLHRLRVSELVTLGSDQVSAEQRSAKELQEMALVYASQGRNPAEIAYNLAKVRGFTGKAPQKTVSAAEQLEMAKKGAAAAGSLGGGGDAGGGRMSAKALLAMDDEEFEAATKGDKWKKLMGG